MCGRFTLTVELEALFERFALAYPPDVSLTPSFNIAPTHQVLAVVRGEKGNKLGTLQWGLVPSWAKDPAIGSKMINARSETVHEKASFKSLIHRQRCLILADSFYEWKKTDGKKQPYRILLKDERPFAFAGLWSVWKSGSQTLSTCTVLTTAANAFMSPIHERMPVILDQENEDVWVDPRHSFDQVKHLLQSFPEAAMKMYPVSTSVNRAGLNTPELVNPITI